MTSFNECYIGGVSGASSPLTYEYHLMVRFINDRKQNIALVTGYPVGLQGSLKPV